MDDAAIVRGGERSRQRHRRLDRARHAERPARDLLAQRLAGDELPGDEHLPVELFEGVDGRDTGVTERRHGARFAPQPLAPRRVARELRCDAPSARRCGPAADPPPDRRRPCRPGRAPDRSGTGRRRSERQSRRAPLDAGQRLSRRLFHEVRRARRAPPAARAPRRAAATSPTPLQGTRGGCSGAARAPDERDRSRGATTRDRVAVPGVTSGRILRARAATRLWRPSSAASASPARSTARRRLPPPTSRRRSAARRCAPAADPVRASRVSARSSAIRSTRAGPRRSSSRRSSSVTCT